MYINVMEVLTVFDSYNCFFKQIVFSLDLFLVVYIACMANLFRHYLSCVLNCRVVVVSSSLHEKGKLDFNDLNLRHEIEEAKKGKSSRHNPGYCNTKLMNVYFARALAYKLKDAGVDVHACCPSFCYTNLFRYVIEI